MTGSAVPGTGVADHPTTGHGTTARDVYGIVAGSIGSVTVSGRTPVRWPHRVGVVPPIAAGRLRRSADVALDAAFVAGGGAAVVGQVLSGLGGVGKTQLAAGLAHAWWQQQRVELLVWVTATSRTAVLARYAQTATDVTGVEDPDPEQGAERLLAWLASTDRRWLIVLDDLTDPADLRGLWPPVTGSGRTVVTARRRDAALLAGRALINVDLFTPAEAVAYLQGKLGDRPHRLDQAAELAEDLGWLPLALAQAAAYIIDQDLTCADYRRRLTRRRLHAMRPNVLPDDQKTAVADTWALSIDLADAATTGTAGLLLQLAALLDPNGIPAQLFTTTAVTAYCTSRGPVSVDAEDAHDALRALRRLSLVSIAPPADTPAAGHPSDTPATIDAGMVRVHALLQRVVRESTPAEYQHSVAVTAADAIAELWPSHEPDATAAQPLRANTIILHQHTGRHLWTTTEDAHPVLFRTGASLGNTGLVTAARDYYQHLHSIAADHLGPDHPDTLATRYHLAAWRGEAGDLAGAATAFTQLLDDRLRVLGPDHPDTLATRHNLARWRGHAGDPAGAATAFTQLLDDRLRVLGPDHPDTLTTRSNLARWRGEAGDLAGAATAFTQLLDDRLRVLGPDHPDTLATRSNLARWRGEAGDPAGAATAFAQLLDDHLRVLGPDHPETLTTRHYLASWRGHAGDPAGAATAFEQLLDDSLRVLGPDHWATLNTRHNLAYWWGHAGDPAGAAKAFERLLDDYVRVLGPDHPETLTTRHNLADWREKAGNPAGAATSSSRACRHSPD
ncbi:FxSxx-COOH system tetratricopeptide repeat protein [Dactylosporangium cerinum]|uniref:FxSxx-COOH system tetratricopeptide repeat protein n=1 Tax=Dactylosporangium cerinum TaxID=1434730 RepID=A0ABV9W435_9ACTN